MSDVEAMTKTAEERAREIVDRGPLVTLSVAERYIELIASALRQTERAVWLEAAEVAELYAEENRQMASDSVLLDPFLSGKSRSLEAVAKSQELQIHGCVHSSMFHAAQNIAAALRRRAEEV